MESAFFSLFFNKTILQKQKVLLFYLDLAKKVLIYDTIVIFFTNILL